MLGVSTLRLFPPEFRHEASSVRDPRSPNQLTRLSRRLSSEAARQKVCTRSCDRETAMAASAVARQQLEFDILPPLRSREDVISRYRHVREVSKRFHDDLLKLIPRSAILKQARKLGLLYDRTLLLDSVDQLAFLFDLAIYTAPPDRTSAIERYARSVRFAPESDEARVLKAMRNARFTACMVKRRHEIAGLVMGDLLRRTEFWLVDEGLERTLPDGDTLVTRVFAPDAFSVTCGVMMPVDLAIMTSVFYEVVPRLNHHTIEQICQDRRFAEAIYRTAMADGVMDEIDFQDPLASES